MDRIADIFTGWDPLTQALVVIACCVLVCGMLLTVIDGLLNACVRIVRGYPPQASSDPECRDAAVLREYHEGLRSMLDRFSGATSPDYIVQLIESYSKGCRAQLNQGLPDGQRTAKVQPVPASGEDDAEADCRDR